MIIILSTLLVLINSLAQILLKLGAMRSRESKAILSINIPILIGYFLFLVTTVLSVYLLKVIPLKNFTLIIALNYIVTLLFSYIILKEKLSRQKFLASFMIIVGVIVFNL
ncbi:hypothetical protein EL84_02665 [Paenibacillus sp. VT-400]|uniref:EamA family transporter n=1 Tax=Paenibacillus sp. VT-400 TaxID=1495853 RepID=UPI0006492C1A|nr:hypothetical protein EL84_02665 [Paenibacillus sp. VT-400]